MCLFKIPSSEEMEKYIQEFHEMNENIKCKNMWKYPSRRVPLSTWEAKEKLKEIINFPIMSNMIFLRAYYNTLIDLFENYKGVMLLSSLDYEGKPFPIFNDKENSPMAWNKRYTSCMIYGEIYINLDSHSSFVYMDILSYSSPREMKYSDIYWMSSCNMGVNLSYNISTILKGKKLYE